MKRILAFLLALTMVLALCACGGKSQTDHNANTASASAAAAENATPPEEEAETPSETTVVCAPGDVVKSDTLQIEVSGVSFADTISAHGKEYSPESSSMIFGRIHMKVKNTGKETVDLTRTLPVRLDYAQGFVYSTGEAKCYLTIPEDPSLYAVFQKTGSKFSVQYWGEFWKLAPLAEEDCVLSIPCAKEVLADETGTLDLIITLPVDGVDKEHVWDAREMTLAEAEPTDSPSADDRIAVEETMIKRQSNSFIAMKVRNNSDEAKEITQLNVQFLDSNGDVLTTADVNVYNLEAGQAASSEYAVFYCAVDDIAAVKVIGYRYGTGTKVILHFDESDRYKLDNPIVIPIEDIIMQ